ncbi:glycosyltransferase family 4 protein [Candidatus Campbellbacteria bacterium]|nr:MAG: glycosyltransferase family 4 protein [Candidatus Campbellbacteria bacterium]
MRILIATGIYPPYAGGPSYYAKSLKDAFEKLGHTVIVRTFTIEHNLPTGIRHLVFFFKTVVAYIRADVTLVFDTFSVALPVVLLQKLFGGKMIIRTGGDFLWEQYVERTHEKVPFSKFYLQERHFTRKEKMIFSLTRWVLRCADHVVFNSEYQRRIWCIPYVLTFKKTSIIENAFDGSTVDSCLHTKKNFLCITRNIQIKNTDILRNAFVLAQKRNPTISLDVYYDIPHSEAMRMLGSCYCAILVSVSDIAPNFALEALSMQKPIILTKENGISDRIGTMALYVDPLDTQAIADAMVTMADDTTYDAYVSQIKKFSYRRIYDDIARDFIQCIQNLG